MNDKFDRMIICLDGNIKTRKDISRKPITNIKEIKKAIKQLGYKFMGNYARAKNINIHTFRECIKLKRMNYKIIEQLEKDGIEVKLEQI